ncbi:MAG: hypothetical protein M1812_007006 [Candelaria pacifica]|nr:MAG: hypothetical protein M1812_007006 [Candelaria pacifica]
MSGPANGQSPRSSTSSRPSIRSSVTQSSGFSSPQSGALNLEARKDHRHNTRIDGQDSVDARLDIVADGSIWGSSEPEQDKDFPRRGHRPRHSGGFLLDPAFPPGATAYTFAHDTAYAKDLPADTTESGGHRLGIGSPEKRRQAHHLHRPKTSTSVGSSPLATEVTNAAVHYEQSQAVQRATDPDLISFAPSKSDHDVGMMHGGGSADFVEGKDPLKSDKMSKGGFASVGLDTDPAQIVNLALNLNESRRRNQFSTRLYGNGGNTRRVTSAGQNPPSAGHGDTNPTVGGGGSLRQRLQQQRRISRNISPAAGNSNRLSSASYNLTAQREKNTPFPATFPGPPAPQQDEEIQYPLSNSTLARVEKAKNYLELSAEHKRLLALLPPLKTRPSTSRKTSSTEQSSPSDHKHHESIPRVTSRTNDEIGLGRSYNPLQSIRNRRVRTRERANIDPELEGWNQTARVKTWIHRVEKESTLPNYQAADNAQLPPWFGANRPESGDQSNLGVVNNHHSKSSIARRKQPLLYWSISPAELLADVYWVEQAEHKTLIEDKDNNKLYPRDIRVDIPKGRRSYELPAPKRNDGLYGEKTLEEHFKNSKEVPATAAVIRDDDTGRDRGRHRRQLQDTIRSHINRSSSRRKQARLRIDTARSRSNSRSSSSDSGSFRGRKKYSKRSRGHTDDISSSVLEKQMIDLLEKEAKDIVESGLTNRDGLVGDGRPQAGTSPKDTTGRTAELDGRSDPLVRSERGRKTGLFRKSIDHSSSTKQTSLGAERGLKSDGMKIIANGAITVTPPSMSVPSSRDVSPKRRPFNVFIGDRTKAKNAISENDFAVNAGRGARHMRQQSPEREPHEGFGLSRPRTWSPTKRSSLTKNEHNRTKDHQRSDSKGRKLAVGDKDGEPMKRGIFRNGRIEELVRNEVSRVGELMWKKDGAGEGSNLSSSASSYFTDSSDSNEYDSAGSGLATKSKERLGRASRDDHHSDSRKKAGDHALHKYHMDNLPTFTSPFNRDGGSPKRASPEADHITRQQLARKEQRRPSRLDRLAPPRIDMRSVSPTSSPDLSRTATHETDGSYNDSRRGSSGSGRRADVVPFNAHQNVRSADMRLSAVLGLPGTVGRGGPPVTGLAGLASDRQKSFHRPSMHDKREWSISNRVAPTGPAPADKREIARVQALLLSSGVKAKEISRRANEIRDPPSFLRKVCSPPFPRIPASREHVVAAQMLSRDLERSSQQLEDRLSNSSANGLLDQIEAIQDRIRAKMTPLVRATADNADAFSTELTTTHTLAIKQLNDSVDLMLRRRRRRLRWVRRGGYVLLEWILLGVMWWVWLIVVVVRLIKGSIVGIVGSVRWVLWL